MCKNFNVALVIPHPGQGTRYNNLEGQTTILDCPSKLENTNHAHTIGYAMARKYLIFLINE